TNLIGHTINDMTKGSAHDTELRWSSDANTPVDASLAITLVLYLLNKAYDSDIGSFVLLQQYVDDDQIDRGLKEAITYGSGDHEDEMISKGVLEVANLIEERGGQLGYRELFETGNAAQRIGQFEVAMGHYRQALRALENDEGDPSEILRCRLNIAETNQALNKMQDAKADYQKILEASRNPPTVDPNVESVVLMRLNHLGLLTSRYLSLEDKLLESLPLLLDAVEIQDHLLSEGEGDGSAENFLSVLRKLEATYRALGDEDKASETKKRWLAVLGSEGLLEENFNPSSNSPITQFLIEHIVGDTIESTPEEKISMLDPFLKIAKAEKNRLAEISITRDMANIYSQAGEREKAIECFLTCREFYRKSGGGPSGPADEFNAIIGLLKNLDEDSPEYQELFAEAEKLAIDTGFKIGEQMLLGLSWDGGGTTTDSPPEEKIAKVKQMMRILAFKRQEPEPDLETIANLSQGLGGLFLIVEDRELISRDDALGYLREALEIHKSLDSDTEVIQELYQQLLFVQMVGMHHIEDKEVLAEIFLSNLREEMLYFQKIGKSSEFSLKLKETFERPAFSVYHSTDLGKKLMRIPSILEKLEDPDISPSMKEVYQDEIDVLFEPDFFRAELRYLIRLPFKIGISLFSLTLLTIVSSLTYYLLMIANLGNLVTAVGVIILLPFLIASLGGIRAVLPIWRRSQSLEDLFRLGLMVENEESNSFSLTRGGRVALRHGHLIGEEE
ncbi:hypothetical protein N9525_07015, partial [Flavobacteriaceae bacterium]|nr:hypothetical protein [Flavobacteriaceae bacterium]